MLRGNTDYDSSATLGNLLRYRGTVLPGVLYSPIFIVCLFIYVSVSVCVHIDTCSPHLPAYTTKDIGEGTALLTFFLAFFSTNCYNRFLTQYTFLKSIEGHMRSIGLQVRNRFCAATPAQEREERLRQACVRVCVHVSVCDTETELLRQECRAQYQMIELFRYLSASYFLLFVRLYSGEKENFNLDSALQEGLITYQERAQLHPMTPSMRWFKCLYWSYDHVLDVQKMDYCDKSRCLRSSLCLRTCCPLKPCVCCLMIAV